MSVLHPDDWCAFDDPTFEACRDERCEILAVHAANGPNCPRVDDTRGRPPATCPSCFSPLIRGNGPHCLGCGWDARKICCQCGVPHLSKQPCARRAMLRRTA